MRILICDDDSIIIEQLKQLIRSYFEASHLKCPEILCYSDGTSLLADQGTKDIVFLDIEMPGMNGIYIGNELARRNHQTIIFVVTSYLEYLDDAMRFHVFRYLSKPLDKRRFYRNMKDAINLYYTFSATVVIETKHGVHTVTTASIAMIEAVGRKIIVYTDTGAYESVQNFLYWVEHLPSNTFFRTHRSYIVNFGHITDFDRSLIQLGSIGKTAYLTKRKYSAFKEAYFLYLESTR